MPENACLHIEEPEGDVKPDLRVPPVPPPTPSTAGAEANDDPLVRFQARQEQRERWLRTRREEKRWEERWKAAGDRLRARSGATAPPKPASAPPPPPVATPSTARNSVEPANPTATTRAPIAPRPSAAMT